jgi:hypothetical protein
MDLEVARADRRLHSVAVPAGVGERLRNGRLARPEEAQQTPFGRRRARKDAAYRLRLDGAGPEPLQLARGSRQHDDDALPRFEHEAWCSAGETERERTLRNRRLLAHTLLEVDVRPSHALRKASGDVADLTLQGVVEAKPDSGGTRDELDGAIVVRRTEPPGDDAQIGAQPLRERSLELVLAVAHDDDARRLDAQPQQLGGDKGPVQVVAVAADELAAGDDDDSARCGQTPGRMPRAVTISVLTLPPGSNFV